MYGIAGFCGHSTSTDLLGRLTRVTHDDDPTEQTTTGDGFGLLFAPRTTAAPSGLATDDRYSVVYAGSLYNVDDLREELADAAPAGTTDADVVLAAFAAWGTDTFDKLRGPFALAVWDSAEQTMTLARDHLGIAQLYLHTDDKGSIFASRLQSLLNTGLFPAALNERVAYRFLAFGTHDEGTDTFFDGISRVLPGEMVHIKGNDVTRSMYTCLRDELQALIDAEAAPYTRAVATEFREKLTASVRRRLRGEGLVGTSLSGGIDSSTLTLIVDSYLHVDEPAEQPDAPADQSSEDEPAYDGEATVVDSPSDQTADADVESAPADSPSDQTPAPEAEAAPSEPTPDASSETEDEDTVDVDPAPRSPEAERIGEQQQTFSVVFPRSKNDEERYIDAVLAACGDRVMAHKTHPSAVEFADDLRDFIRTQEEPLSTSGAYAQYAVMREAAGNVSILLDGYGADELLAGHTEYYKVFLKQLGSSDKRSAFGEVATSLDILGTLARLRLQGQGGRSTSIAPVLSAEFSQKFADERPVEPKVHLRSRLVADIFGTSLQTTLRHTAKNASRFGIEARAPFLDLDLVRFVFAQGDPAFIHEGWNKRILRDATRTMLPDAVQRRRTKINFSTPEEEEWLARLRNMLHETFTSERFMARPWVDSAAVLEAFTRWVRSGRAGGVDQFWRLFNLELWCQEFIDDAVEPPAEPEAKSDYAPNPGKELDIALSDDTSARRYPLRTEKFTADDDLEPTVVQRLTEFFENLPDDHAAVFENPWYVFVSEKVVAITQGRSYFLYEIKPGMSAKWLSRFVTKSPAGVGLGSPYTMQLAISEAGLPRILWAAAGAAAARAMGRKGTFYEIAGNDIRAIEGPTENSYPEKVQAKLAPKNPDLVAGYLSDAIRDVIPDQYKETFVGTIVIHASAVAHDILGNDGNRDDEERLAEMFVDNPLGSGDDSTPLAVVVDLG